MDDAPQQNAPSEPPCDLTLREAAELYAVSARTLALHIRCGQLPAHMSAGATGRQWRVTRDALDAAGYRLRTPPPEADGLEDPLVAQLRRELAAARRATAAERRRAEDADRRLGHAMLECGRLRAALAAAGQDLPSSDAQLDVGAARWLVTAVRRASLERRPSGMSSAQFD